MATRSGSTGIGRVGTPQGYEGRGFFVPHGFTVSGVAAAARALETHFGVAPYLSAQMVAMILIAATSQRQEVCGETDQ